MLIWSGAAPRDRLTWLMEVAPVLLAVPVLAATWRRFPLTPLLYVLLALHAAVLCVGGHYTYAEVPLGFWVRDALGLSRNHYDRLGHLMQGFVPALVARELLLRTSPLRPGRWLFDARDVRRPRHLGRLRARRVARRGAAPARAPTRSSGRRAIPWDTQWDMFLALAGRAARAAAAVARAGSRAGARRAPPTPHADAGWRAA